MSTPVAPSRREQLDISALLESFPDLTQIAIVTAAKGDTVATLGNALAGKFQTGKLPGLSIIVEQPKEKPLKAGAQPILETRTHTVVIVEKVMDNRLQDGSGNARAGMTYEEAKDYVKAALHSQFLGLAKLLWSGTQPFQDGNGGFGYALTFEIEGSLKQTRGADPIITIEAGVVTLTGASFDGEVIRYTTDGSTPAAANAAAVIYTVPFAVASGDTVRAASTATGRISSGITQKTAP